MKDEIKDGVSSDILPKAGAGQEGTDDLVDTYTKDTPGQETWKIKTFKEFTKED